MPWPPRLLVSPPLLPLLTLVLISSAPQSFSASALSFPDGQPEYPSQPELTSDRDALARIFLQGLFEKEGKSRLPHSYAKGDVSNAWMINGLSPKRSDGGNSNGHHYFSLQDIYPRDLHEKAYGDIAGIEEALSSQNDDLSAQEPHSERERIISELLARGHPYTGHRAHGYADPSQLSDDPEEQTARLKELLRIVMGDDDTPNEYLSGYDDHHGTRSAFKDGDGAWSENGRRIGSTDTGLRGRSAFAKRDPFGINARGFHDDVFNRDFGSFNPMKRVARSTNEHRKEGGNSGREGKNKTESEQDNKTRINGPGFGGMDKDEASRRVKRSTEDNIKNAKPLKQDLILPQKTKEVPTSQVSLNRGERAADDGRSTSGESIQESKRRPEMDSSGFHGDTFNSGFGDFWTMKRNSHHQNPLGMFVKRRPEMDSSGFHGDTFNSGFGDFWTMKRMVGGVYPPGYDQRERVSSPGKRRPEMDSSGFHGDTFSSGFGDFYTMKRNPTELYQEKRRPEMDSSGFHGDTFSRGFGDFWTMKRNQGFPSLHKDMKRRPEMDSSGFHGDTFNSGFGDFWTMKRNAMAHPLGHPLKRRPEMDSSGFHGDTFNSGFGDFWTMKRDGTPGAVNFLRGSSMQGDAPLTLKGRTGEEWHADGEDNDGDFKLEESSLYLGKRRPEMDSSGFHGDTFNGGFGDFWTMKRSQPSPVARMKRDVGREDKRRPEMDASGFHGDTFSNGFGDFWTLKRAGEGSQPRWTLGKLESKRRPEMDSSGFHGDTFNGGFGDFWTMKRNHPIPYPTQFSKSKRRPEMDSSGFHGDTFNGGFGDFWTMKRGEGVNYALSGPGSFLHPSKRKPEMDSSGFHGDTFNGGFGDFWTMKRGSGTEEEMKEKQDAEEEDETKVHHVFRGEESTGGYGALSHNAKETMGDDVENEATKDTGTRGENEKGRVKSDGKSDNIKN